MWAKSTWPAAGPPIRVPRGGRSQWGYQIASVHGARGEVDEAFRWLERSYELHDTGVVLARVTHWFKSLRGDPRWPKFLAQVGLVD